jgi:hypothetical protein
MPAAMILGVKWNHPDQQLQKLGILRPVSTNEIATAVQSI